MSLAPNVRDQIAYWVHPGPIGIQFLNVLLRRGVNLDIAVLDKPREDTIEPSNSRFTHLIILLLFCCDHLPGCAPRLARMLRQLAGH